MVFLLRRKNWTNGGFSQNFMSLEIVGIFLREKGC
jgi:hypothetical protein